VVVLVAAGIDVMPTFRRPNVTLAFKGDLDEGLARLERADHDRRPTRAVCRDRSRK